VSALPAVVTVVDELALLIEDDAGNWSVAQTWPLGGRDAAASGDADAAQSAGTHASGAAAGGACSRGACSCVTAARAVAAASAQPAVTYESRCTYGDDHWGVRGAALSLARGDPLAIAVLWWQGGGGGTGEPRVPVIVRLNPTDARGHRMLVIVTDAADPRRTFNRAPTAGETAALHAALGLMSQALQHLGAVPQTFVAGNNAHSVRSRDGGDGDGASGGGASAAAATSTLHVGSEAEMGLIHGHVFARGPPGRDVVVPGAPLRGPPPGEEFCLSRGKVAYGAGEAGAVVEVLRRTLECAVMRGMAARVFQLRIDVM
jgi:hypothetical protein